MIHVYDTLSAVVGQLNIINKAYGGQGKARTLPKTPDFLLYCIDRMLDIHPDMKEEGADTVTIDMPILSGTGDSFAPVYICVINGITRAAVDKLTVVVDHKGDHGPGIATVVMVPYRMFDDSTIEDTVKILKDIYFGILSLDTNLSFAPSAAMLQVYNSPDIFIPMYDIEMIIATICCIHINMKNWFFDNGSPVGPEYTLNAFSDEEMPEDTKKRMLSVMRRCNSISDVRDGIANGRIIKNFMEADEE